MTKYDTMAPPMTGTKMMPGPQGPAAVWLFVSYMMESLPKKKKLWKRAIIARKSTAPSPATIPTRMERDENLRDPNEGGGAAIDDASFILLLR